MPRDPYYNIDAYMLEKAQRIAAQWILFEYFGTSSITASLSTLEIPTLEQWCQSLRLTLFYNIINNLLPISINVTH